MEILVGALAAWGLLMLIWTVAGFLLLPLGRTRDSSLTVVLRCRGDALWLERQLRGLMWLRDSGILWWNILILNVDMSQEALDRAGRLVRGQSQVRLMDLEELKEWMEAKHEFDGTGDHTGNHCSGPLSK